MKYVAGYCMLVLGGNASPSEKDLTAFLEKAGASNVDGDAVKAVVNALQGKSLHEVIDSGMGKVATLSFGGSGSGAGNTGGAPAQEAPKEEAPVEEEEAFEIGGLFD
eukprot:TRINITY_DN5850_c0_g1_i1.p2 TRINITY_DN5850_c0_g1~~TRINITY_DN5850_c0_g1_i1.p2  ORF type:complete len:107 (+),score=22.04 TRINITY_DN5850_c0_g1_i1:3-323(+)